MQNQTPNSPARKQSLQARLVLVFSLLFVFSILALSFFLFNILNIIEANNQSRLVFEENRRIYQIESLFKQYHLGLVNYAVSSSSLAEMRLTSLERRIDETLADLQQLPPTGNPAPFESLARQKESLSTLTLETIEAIYEQEFLDPEEQDWSEPLQLTEQVNTQFETIYAELNLLRQQGKQQIETITAQAETRSQLAFSLGLIAIPIFIGLALLVAITIYLQINLPLAQLARAATDLKERKFKPQDLAPLVKRSDEIGDMAREFLKMAEAVQARTAQLEQEAAEIRAKIK
jgi:methyl-accepting chemotaxis protein